MIFNMAGGGGGNDTIYAALIVYIDTGSAITVTDGVSTFTGTSVNGECLFDRLTPATWVVTATNGVDTATENVVITNSALIDGYPDPLISTAELSYAGDNTVVAYFWGLVESNSTGILTRNIYSGCDSDYFAYDYSSFTAQTDFNAIVHIFGLGSDVTTYATVSKNNSHLKTVTFNYYDSLSDSLAVSFSTGDTFKLLGRNGASSAYGSVGMFVEVSNE